MIDFEGYYSVAVEQIKYIGTDKKDGDTYPYRIKMNLLSGETLIVSYMTEAAAKEAKERICRKIESEQRREAENILIRLRLIEAAVNGLDKRQLKMLLNIEQGRQMLVEEGKKRE